MVCLSEISFRHLVPVTPCYLNMRVKVTRASVALPSAVLLATVAGSKVYPGRLHVLMIDSSLAPCRDTCVRPENMETGTRLVCIWVLNRVFPLHKSCPVTCTGPAHAGYVQYVHV